MANCKYCGNGIYWFKAEDGTFVPMEHDTRERHNCPKLKPQREAQLLKCNKCGGAIYFDDKQVSASGKKIPIDYETDQPHECTGEAHDREKAWDEDQNYWRRKN